MLNRQLGSCCLLICAIDMASIHTAFAADSLPDVVPVLVSDTPQSLSASDSNNTTSAPVTPQTQSLSEPEFVAVPFIFATDTLSTAVGAAGVIKHAGQQQATALGIGLYTSNDSWLGYTGLFNYQIPQWQQWLFSFEGYRAHYQEGIYYLPDNRVPNPGVDDTQKVISVGEEAYYRLKMKYILPWGHGANGAAASLTPMSERLNWNPLTSGVSSIQLMPFFRRQTLAQRDNLPDEALGVALELNWDNRDNGRDSTQGGQTNLTFSRDFGSSERASWTTWEFEQSGFLSLAPNDWFAQQVLAANFYLADTPTWNSGDEASPHRPPSFAGVFLGGFEHLRGYASRQFTGRSAVDYMLEYRVRPRWQPLQAWPVFRLYNVPWWEWVAFFETGKVSNEFDLSQLHQDMKISYGLAVRFEVEDIVVRTEFAFGGDESQVWVMVNQPF